MTIEPNWASEMRRSTCFRCSPIEQTMKMGLRCFLSQHLLAWDFFGMLRGAKKTYRQILWSYQQEQVCNVLMTEERSFLVSKLMSVQCLWAAGLNQNLPTVEYIGMPLF